MKYPLTKERIYLMAPGACVCACALFDRAVAQDALHDAIAQAVRANRILCARVTVAPNGDAFIEDMENAPAVALTKTDAELETLATAQSTTPFDIGAGETARFFYAQKDGQTSLLAVVHHIVCDGGSIIRLMGDILRALNGEALITRPIRLLTESDLPKRAGLNPVMKLLMRRTHAQWAKSGQAFTLADRKRVAETYAARCPQALRSCVFTQARTAALARLCRERGITVNSLITAAFASALPIKEHVGAAVSVRPEGLDGMGNFATGIGVKTTYDSKHDLLENTVRFHHDIQKTRGNPSALFFLHDFMAALPPTLVDSLYFSLYDGFDNRVSASACSMCGYRDSPGGLSLTNLTTLSMPEMPKGAYHIERMHFIPPYIANVRGVVGASTYSGQMTLTLSTQARLMADEGARFERVCTMLESIADDAR